MRLRESHLKDIWNFNHVRRHRKKFGKLNNIEFLNQNKKYINRYSIGGISRLN